MFDHIADEDDDEKTQEEKDDAAELKLKLEIRKLERQIERSDDAYEAWQLQQDLEEAEYDLFKLRKEISDRESRKEAERR